MRNKFVTTLIILTCGVLSSTLEVEECERACPNTYIAAQGICSSDGKVYADLCFARCFDKSAVALFACSFPFDEDEKERCSSKCAEQAQKKHDHKHNESPALNLDGLILDCDSKCETPTKNSLICASDGAVYANECYAKCFDNTVTQLFECTELGESGCAEKCETALHSHQCAEKCPWLVGKYHICASDGKLYAGECRAKCANPENTSLFSCGKLGEKECKKECDGKIAIQTCQNNCPKYRRRLMYWCANDGKVYDDLCKAQCVDKSIEFTFNCEDKGISTDNKSECERICKPLLSCEKQCADKGNRHVCAKDGVIYKNSCLAECKDLRVLYSVHRISARENRRCAQRASMVGAQFK
jgi:hypothetical protein